MSKTKNSGKIIIYEMGVAALLKVLLMKFGDKGIYYYDISPSSFLLKILFGIPFIRKRITSIVRQYVPSKYISEYEGAFFLIENMTVDLTISFFNDRRISDTKVVRAYKNHYGTDRINMVVKYFIQNKIRSFLRFYYQVKRSEDNITVIVPESELYRYISWKNPFSDLKPTRMVFSGLKVFHVLYGIELFAASFFEMLSTLFRQKYTFHKPDRQEYKICMRAHIPKSEGLLRNDFLINGKEIKSGDILFFINGGDKEHRKRMSEYYKKYNYHYTALEDLNVPLYVIPSVVKDYLLLPFRIFMLYLLERQFHAFNALLTFSRIALRIKYELLFYYYDFRMMIMFHSAGSEMVIAPVLCKRHDSKFAIYNFGSTVSWGRWSPYAFQTADYYFTWGDKIVSLYSPTCEFGEVVKVGFWGKEEYLKICSRRDELKKEIVGANSGRRGIRKLLKECLLILKTEGYDKLLKKYPCHSAGNPNVFKYNGYKYTYRWTKHVHSLGLYKENLEDKLKDEFTTLDIGSSYGIFSYLLKNEFKDSHHLLLDFPEQLILAYYFLGICFPDAKIAGYKELSKIEQIDRDFIEQYDFILLPWFFYRKLTPKSIDLVTNFASLGEMKREWFDYYLKSEPFLSAKYFFTVNRFQSYPIYDSDLTIMDYPLNDFNKLHFAVSPIFSHTYIRKNLFFYEKLSFSSQYFEFIGERQ